MNIVREINFRPQFRAKYLFFSNEYDRIRFDEKRFKNNNSKMWVNTQTWIELRHLHFETHYQFQSNNRWNILKSLQILLKIHLFTQITKVEIRIVQSACCMKYNVCDIGDSLSLLLIWVQKYIKNCRIPFNIHLFADE